MNVTIKITPSPGLVALLQRGQDLSPVLEGAGQAAVDYLRRYHSQMDWKGDRWLSPSLGFADKVVQGWQDPTVSGNRVTITNTFGLLAWKVTGGEITPKSAEFLTIPLISEAKGKSVAEYRSGASEPLFRAGMALCQKVGGQLQAVYALSKGVTQTPVRNALPTNEALAGVFVTAAKALLTRTLTRAA
jgi:hypothetical protein